MYTPGAVAMDGMIASCSPCGASASAMSSSLSAMVTIRYAEKEVSILFFVTEIGAAVVEGTYVQFCTGKSRRADEYGD